jgi:hypothetical protein
MVNQKTPLSKPSSAVGYYKPPTEPGYWMGPPRDEQSRGVVLLPPDSRVATAVGESPMPKKASGRRIRIV